MLIVDAEARVCESCYVGDLAPVTALKGYYRKVRMHRIDSRCTHCNKTVVGEWHYEEIRTVLDCIELEMEKLRSHYEYENVVKDVSQRVTDSLLSDDNENSPYLLQQLRYLRHVIASRGIEQTFV